MYSQVFESKDVWGLRNVDDARANNLRRQVQPEQLSGLIHDSNKGSKQAVILSVVLPLHICFVLARETVCSRDSFKMHYFYLSSL